MLRPFIARLLLIERRISLFERPVQRVGVTKSRREIAKVQSRLAPVSDPHDGQPHVPLGDKVKPKQWGQYQLDLATIQPVHLGSRLCRPPPASHPDLSIELEILATVLTLAF